ncbi:endo-1,4-beta-xylanase [Saliterribacillus persicus]|uniref:Beta-xylanase n=1 Tax=Saliterribacillus persicus TaxID=930114 RepID=A0A368Y7I4_9BACI|nr:endo-1,4-beta-xylanase [Saliterribacillus persicus]RCW74777.1 endo-1,4-beta-xylanase [Saliterribacillus persicus]
MYDQIPSLKEVFKTDFHIGAAVNPKTLKSSKELLDYHFSSITAENVMKFEVIHPKKDTYDFTQADLLADYARKNDKKMRGHTLVWHNQTPNWVFENTNKEKVLSMMKQHIFKIVERYKDVVHAWDVVNEAIDDKAETFYRKSPWLDLAGEEFIEKAFLFAHEADPQATLFYNDYNACDPVKSEKIYQLVKRLKEKGVPIHGIGMQAHWNIYDPSIDEIRAAIKKYVSLGVEIHITEMDVSVFEFEDKRTDLTQPTEEMISMQQKRYREFFDIFKEYKEHIGSVTFWGIADDYTWLDDFPQKGRKNWPFLFDDKQQPKEVFFHIIK